MLRWSAALLALALALGAIGCGGDDTKDAEMPTNTPPRPLATALRERAEASAAKMPDELKTLFGRAAKELAESGILERARGVGTKAPDVAFEAASGQRVSLSTLLASGPVIVAFYRGKW